MTLVEARAAIGRKVVYLPRSEVAERGVIYRVGNEFVFVRYEGEYQPKATRPEDLVFAQDVVPCSP